MSDELDIAFDKTTCIMGRTDLTVDQVGSGGSTAMERDSWPMRRVAAEARRVLLDMGQRAWVCRSISCRSATPSSPRAGILRSA
jgi:hypothetical protein